MAPTVIVLVDDFGSAYAAGLGANSPTLALCLLHDTVAAASTLRDAQVLVRYGSAVAPEMIEALEPSVAAEPVAGSGSRAAAVALAEALRSGDPAVLIGPNLPHLPPWRLRDAITHLTYGADAVLGPDDQSGWYLLGLARGGQDMLRSVPGLAEPADLFVNELGDRKRHLALLPAWFTVRTLADLGPLADVLRSMPTSVAAHTRALFEAGVGPARAVGG